MGRILNRIVIVVVASAFLLLGVGCTGKEKKSNSGNAATVGDPDEDPTVFPDPDGDIPTALESNGLPVPMFLPPDPGQIANATQPPWDPKDDPAELLEIQALIDREAAADQTLPAEIIALDLLYSETPTPPDPGQI